MKCQFCNAEIPEDAVFCPECGKEQEKMHALDVAVFCPNCGNRLEAGSVFCPECGARADGQPRADDRPRQAAPAAPQPDFQKTEPVRETPLMAQPAQQPKGKGHIVILIFVLIAVAIIALIVFAVKHLLFDEAAGVSDSDVTKIEDFLEEDAEAEKTDEVDLSDVDYNLMETADLTMEGMVKTAKNGGKVLQWKEELTFYGENEAGERILMEDTTNAYIDGSILPDGFLDTISANKQISIKGTLHFSGNDLYISPIYVYDADGNDMVAQFLDSKDKKEKERAKADQSRSSSPDLSSDYVLPQSSSRLLSRSDVSGLSLQEINYAKNEIYARHGRLFKSNELQTYFDSKSWYNGTIHPDSFSESLLSDVEKKNVEYLKEIEFDMAPGGYQLDAR